ncbi:uncharacterized protein LOC127277431 [Leptopilina boulardi]|uniref:uncharacterized protein LOC127277431 n=1 Tax=Leptopilina boulardi TaxID=63433 RepID=UPI0021F593CF|nr:uncharacterized protein LOC127277431 [Leptopilina boulardi]
MMNTSVFIQQSSEFQFLSVCHYITIFGIYFYNKNLITLEKRSDSVEILNTLFDYLNKSVNENEAKLQLLKKALKESDLYGGGKNETLDMKYVNETYQYIISKALFSHYGNINGYLAKIINSADDVNYSVLKETVFQHLSENYTSKEYCSNDIPLGNYDYDNNPLGNYNSDNNPFGNYDSDNNPIGNNDLKNIPIGNYSSNNNTLGNYSSNNNPLGNYNSNNISSGNYSSDNISSENYSSNNISSGNYSSKLNGLTIQKIFDDHIWRIFPQPEHDMSIMEVNYIYAMVGLKIIKSVSATSSNFTFKEYILISRELDFQKLNNETYEMVKDLFSTPALFFYAYNEKTKFQKIDDFTNVEFWNKAYENLFSYINSTMRKIVQENIENSLHNKIQMKMNKLKTRTLIANELLALICNYKNIAQVSPIQVVYYKTFYLWITKLLLPKHCDKENLNDLQIYYQYQFKEVEELYNKIERIAIEKVLVDSELVEKINLNSTVMFARVPDYQQGCNLCSPIPRKENDDIFLLFAVKEEKTVFYALRQENNTLSLLINNGNEQEFAKAIANDSSLKMEIAIFSKTLKFRNEDYRSFIARVADIKTKLFVDNLKMHYYEETVGEKLLNFAKTLIPFYSCIESAKAGRMAESAFSCSMDVLSLIPFAGWATEYTIKITNSLTVEIGNKYLITNTIARSGIISTLPISAVLNEISTIAVRTIAQEILTKSFLTDLTVASLRTIDPGFESVYQILRFGLKGLRKLFQSIVSNFKKIPSFRNMVVSINSLLKNINKNLLIDHTVPLVLSNQNDFNIVRYFYPGGSHFFGPTCLTSFGNTAELRSIEGYSFPIPVVPEKSPQGIFYKQYLPETNKLSDITFKKDSNDILRRVSYLIDTMISEGKDINVIRNYHVYHNTINWNQVKKEPSDLNEIVDPPESATNTRETILQQNLQLLPTSEFQVTLRGTVTGPNLPEITNIELIGTLRGTIDGITFPIVPHSEVPNIIPKTEVDSSEFLNSKTLKDLLNEGEKAPPPPPPASVKLEPLSDFEFDESLDKIVIPDSDTNSLVNTEISEAVLNNNFFSPKRPTSELNTVTKKRKTEKSKKKPTTIEELDNIPSTSRQEKLNSKLYTKIIPLPTYDKYVEVLTAWKRYGLSYVNHGRSELYYLRTIVNKLALLHLDQGFPLNIPNKLWYNQIVKGEKNIEFLKNLQGKSFFFNDITLLRTHRRSSILKRMKPNDAEIEVKYYITIDSPYGFVNLKDFHYSLQNNIVTFNDVIFRVIKIISTKYDKILHIYLENQGMTKEYWRQLRVNNLNNLHKEEKLLEHPRMSSIIYAANYISEEAPLCTFETSKNYLTNYILSTDPVRTHLVPTYEIFADDIVNLDFHHSYDNWKIADNCYIKDVLFNYNLDEINTLLEARRRINMLYDFTYYQNIEEVYHSYTLLINAKQKIRFEDYYTMYSYAKHNLAMTKIGIRRMEVAIYRLALRQCGAIMKLFKLHRVEIITKEMSTIISEIFNNNKLFAFDNCRKFSLHRGVEAVKILNTPMKSTEIPLLMEVTLRNQVGLADINDILTNEYLSYVITANLEFVIDDLKIETLYGNKVMIMKMHDYESPTEKRMIQMANRLNELLSTETNFFWDLKEI